MTEANGDHNESSNLPKPFEFNKTSTSTSTSTKGEESPLMSTVFYDNFLNKINNNFIEEDNPEIISNPPTTQSFPSFNDTDVQGNMLMLKRMVRSILQPFCSLQRFNHLRYRLRVCSPQYSVHLVVFVIRNIPVDSVRLTESLFAFLLISS